VIMVLLNVNMISSHMKCRHDEIMKNEIVHHLPMTDRHCRFRKRCLRKKDGTFRSIKIKTVY